MKTFVGDDGTPVVVWERSPFSEKAESKNDRYYAAQPEKRIFVRSNFRVNLDGEPVPAFFEKHAAHPGGYAFVEGFEPVLIALTTGAAATLSSGLLVEMTTYEAITAEAETIKKLRAEIRDQKESYRLAFIELIGSENGFETAWQSVEKRETLVAVLNSI